MGKPRRSELIAALLVTKGQALDRDSLDRLDDKELHRLFLSTMRQRLNPTSSTEFWADGISHAEAEARAERFVRRCSRDELEAFAVKLVMCQFESDAQLEAQEQLVDAWRHIPDALMVAWGKERAIQQEVKRLFGKSGGEKAAEKVAAVRSYALALATQRRPLAGWSSAPKAAESIYGEVRDFARSLGRSFSRRAVEGWLRDAGIKRGG